MRRRNRTCKRSLGNNLYYSSNPQNWEYTGTGFCKRRENVESFLCMCVMLFPKGESFPPVAQWVAPIGGCDIWCTELGRHGTPMFVSGLRDLKGDRLAHSYGFHSQNLVDKECWVFTLNEMLVFCELELVWDCLILSIGIKWPI